MEKVLVVFADYTIDKEECDEFLELVKAAEMECIQIFQQNLQKISVKTYIGKGKCEEILEYIHHHEISSILFHKDLSPLQVRNLQTLFNIPIFDRSDLILEIFSKRAKSKTARLQIENAILKRKRSRLIGSNKHLGRQSASGKNKGKGEKQLELDRRNIATKITQTTRELKQLEATRNTQRRSRNKSVLPLVALVGYTNAGKSTILNEILQATQEKTAKQVLEKNMLFATLDTSIRQINYKHHEFLLSDTVGFVNDLPHELIEAFHSTLEEITYADLLIEVIDTSNPNYRKQMDITADTLKTIHASDLPIIHIFNKCDCSEIPHPQIHGNDLYISAKTDIDFLLNHLYKIIYPSKHTLSLLIPYSHTTFYAHLLHYAHVVSREDAEDGMHIVVEVDDSILTKCTPYIKKTA